MRGNQSELGQVRAYCIDQLRALAHQQIARPVQHQHGLLIGGLDGHEPHGRSRHRLADGSRVGSIVLAALDVRLHVARRHQTHIVPERLELARPMVRCGAGFHADQAGRHLLEKADQLPAAELPRDHRLSRSVDAMHLEHVLGDIQTDRANLHVDDPLR